MPKDHCFYIFTKIKGGDYVPSGVWNDLSCACHRFLEKYAVGFHTEPVEKLRWVKWKSSEMDWQIEQLDSGEFGRREMRLYAKQYRTEVSDQRMKEAEQRRIENRAMKQEKERRKQMKKMRGMDLQG